MWLNTLSSQHIILEPLRYSRPDCICFFLSEYCYLRLHSIATLCDFKKRNKSKIVFHFAYTVCLKFNAYPYVIFISHWNA
jgi:hypothetical protein